MMLIMSIHTLSQRDHGMEFGMTHIGVEVGRINALGIRLPMTSQGPGSRQETKLMSDLTNSS